MIADKIGTVFILVASVWMVMLAYIGPGDTTPNRVRVMMISIGVAMLLLALLPAHLNLTGTMLAFICLGLAFHIGLFSIFGIGLTGLAPAILLAIGMVLRRARLDQDVLIVALVGFSLALWTPLPVLFAMTVVGIVNVVLFAPRAFSRTTRQSHLPAHQ